MPDSSSHEASAIKHAAVTRLSTWDSFVVHKTDCSAVEPLAPRCSVAEAASRRRCLRSEEASVCVVRDGGILEVRADGLRPESNVEFVSRHCSDQTRSLCQAMATSTTGTSLTRAIPPSRAWSAVARTVAQASRLFGLRTRPEIPLRHELG